MQKIAVIFYHKNALKIYKPEWIDKCIGSIKNQSFKNFDVFELDYGGGKNMFAYDINKPTYQFHDVKFENHIGAMNYLYNYLFKDLKYDVVFNVNMDDYYAPNRFERQLEAINLGWQLVSSNFYYVNEDGKIFKNMNMLKCGDLGKNLDVNHNIIAHPCVAMHKSFWDDDLQYHDLIGYEDLDLWKRAHAKGKHILILPDYLLYYRTHSNQITKHHENKLASNSHK